MMMQRNRYLGNTQEIGNFARVDSEPTPSIPNEHKRVPSNRAIPYSLRKSTGDLNKISDISDTPFKNKKITESLYASHSGPLKSTRDNSTSNSQEVSEKKNSKIFLRKSPSLQINSLFDPTDLAIGLGMMHIIPNYFKPQAKKYDIEDDCSAEMNIPVTYLTEPIDCSEDCFRVPKKSLIRKRNYSHEVLPQEKISQPGKLERSNSFSRPKFQLWASEKTDNITSHQPVIMKRGGPMKSTNDSPSFFTERVTIKPPKMSFEDTQAASIGDESIHNTSDDENIDSYTMRAIYANESKTKNGLSSHANNLLQTVKKIGMGKENAGGGKGGLPPKSSSGTKPPLYQKNANKSTEKLIEEKHVRHSSVESKPLRSKKIFDFDNR